MTDVQNWQALAQATRRRRRALRLTQVELAHAGELSDATLRRIETPDGRSSRPSTLARLERGLQWRMGLAHEVLAGTATEEEIMPNDASTNADPDPSDQRQRLRGEASGRYADIAARIRDAVEAGRLDALGGYHLELRAEAARNRLLGVEAPRPVTFRSEPVPALRRDALADPDPTAALPPDQGGSAFEMHVEGFSYTTIGKYMVARDRRNRSS